MAELATTKTEWPFTPAFAILKKFIDDFFVIMVNKKPDESPRLAAGRNIHTRWRSLFGHRSLSARLQIPMKCRGLTCL
jgi:hypothetical protein